MFPKISPVYKYKGNVSYFKFVGPGSSSHTNEDTPYLGMRAKESHHAAELQYFVWKEDSSVLGILGEQNPVDEIIASDLY